MSSAPSLLEFSAHELRRIQRLLREYIAEFRLDLKGLTVLTEAASGYYLFTPILCSLAGAEKVYAVTKDSAWGQASAITDKTYDIARRFGCEPNIEVIPEILASHVSEADIVMNMNFVRPITQELVSCMKPTAVIPLMWETWELRPDEIDLPACRARNILVMGTDEQRLGLFDYAGYLTWHLLSQCQIEVFKNRIFVMASGPVAEGICKIFSVNGIDYRWSSYDSDIPEKYAQHFIPPENKPAILEYLSKADALVCAEHVHNRTVIGAGGLITVEELKNANPEICLIYKGGGIDYAQIKAHNIFIHPDKQVRFGTFTTYSYILGPRAVLELNAAGLKVGESMARARLSGMSLAQARNFALANSPAMDFKEEPACH